VFKFIDQALIELRSGDGGNGLIAWRREKFEPMGGPAGGDGGRGGNVTIQATRDLNTLIEFRFKRKFAAEKGQRGGTWNKHGAQGQDMTIMVPPGTVVFDAEDGRIIADLLQDGDKVLVAEGGRGGRGNAALASPTRRAPHFCEPGERGITRKLRLELKLIADVGLIGLPNAGKSSILSVLSAAKPKIADYPFSTLQPNLGVVQNGSGSSFVMADIPGLIEGAANGVGLGHDFLRHIERTKILVHVVDIGDNDIKASIEIIEEELRRFGKSLIEKPRVIALNKIDMIEPKQIAAISKRLKKFAGIDVIAISALAHKNLSELTHALTQLLSNVQEEKVPDIVMGPKDEKAINHGDRGFSIERYKKVFHVSGDRLERLVEVTDARSPESVHHLNQVLRSMGVIEVLLKEGVAPGDEVSIGGLDFVFGENLF